MAPPRAFDACVYKPLLWPYICINDFLKRPENGRKENDFDARMDDNVHHDVARGHRGCGNGQRYGTDRRYRVKPGVWTFADGFGSDIYTSRSRVTNTTGQNERAISNE
jgi:hypothetical protein